jgi:hypothetical protein
MEDVGLIPRSSVPGSLTGIATIIITDRGADEGYACRPGHYTLESRCTRTGSFGGPPADWRETGSRRPAGSTSIMNSGSSRARAAHPRAAARKFTAAHVLGVDDDRPQAQVACPFTYVSHAASTTR